MRKLTGELFDVYKKEADMNETKSEIVTKWHCEYECELDSEGEIDLESVPKLSIQQSEFEKRYYDKDSMSNNEYYFKLIDDIDEDNIYYEFELLDTKEELIENLIQAHRDSIGSYKYNIDFNIKQIEELERQIEELESL